MTDSNECKKLRGDDIYVIRLNRYVCLFLCLIKTLNQIYLAL